VSKDKYCYVSVDLRVFGYRTVCLRQWC
jgi:hypothetical protein